MDTFYTAYTKTVENKIFYFVKKYLVFPELHDVEPVLESYGMHTDFNKACKIAAVNDPKIRDQLFKETEGTSQQAKVIDLNTNTFSSKSIAQ